jgi:hypothetical protein
VQRLQLILPVISVAVLALRRQKAEFDEDIALVLSRHACDLLNVELDQPEALVTTIPHSEGDSRWIMKRKSRNSIRKRSYYFLAGGTHVH